jgi:hypothetical protein
MANSGWSAWCATLSLVMTLMPGVTQLVQARNSQSKSYPKSHSSQHRPYRLAFANISHAGDP